LLEELNRLMSLQALDRRLRELEESLATISSRVDQIRQQTSKDQEELDRLSQEDKQALLARKESERDLAEGEARIRNHRMRLSQLRNDKEYQAMEHEIEALKEGNQRLEAEVLAQMEAAEQRAPRIKELTEAVQKGRAELLTAEKEIAGQLEDAKAALGRQRAERDRVAASIDETLRQRYELIFNRRGGTAVVAVRSGTCQGCRMKIPPQLHNEIQRAAKATEPSGQVVHYCPNCQRILYFEEQAGGSDAK
jgi:predicted  nucleic acid-binding Zn-ribbon protein